MTGIFSRWQPRYAERGIATFPVTAEKTPATKGYLRTGIPGSAQLAEKFQHANAFGFACGRNNKVTLADIDTTNEKVLADALRTYGDTPIISRTASGGFTLGIGTTASAGGSGDPETCRSTYLAVVML